ncbi:MAG: hypothetical protein KA383_06675 [Phycisphaerae bacterium]|nr:hypothetical protein [Phycisphaerae bacterium]
MERTTRQQQQGGVCEASGTGPLDDRSAHIVPGLAVVHAGEDRGLGPRQRRVVGVSGLKDRQQPLAIWHADDRRRVAMHPNSGTAWRGNDRGHVLPVAAAVGRTQRKTDWRLDMLRRIEGATEKEDSIRLEHVQRLPPGARREQERLLAFRRQALIKQDSLVFLRPRASAVMTALHQNDAPVLNGIVIQFGGILVRAGSVVMPENHFAVAEVLKEHLARVAAVAMWVVANADRLDIHGPRVRLRFDAGARSRV